ncbi:MAG: MbnP family protein, partial [Bacteroidota bacterium]|nr:MbnP family protein [Bacteroidota bacterium]
MKTNYISILILLFTLFTSCSNDDDIATTDLTASEPGAINLTFDSQVAGEPFTLDQTYTINGESITINQLRYWVSNIVLINEAGEAVALP